MNIYIKFENNQSGPFDLDKLKSEISSGNIPKDALWSSNQLMWLPLDRLPGLFVSKIIVNAKKQKDQYENEVINDKLRYRVGSLNQNELKSDETIEIIKKILSTAIVLIGAIIFFVIRLSNVQVEVKDQVDVVNNNLKEEKINNKNNEINKNNFNQGEKEGDKNIDNKDGQDKNNQDGDNANKNKKNFGNVQNKPDFIPRDRFHPEEIFEMCAPSVAQIVCGNSTGSGFLVANGILVTNEHVVSSGDKGDEVALKFHSAKGRESDPKFGIILKKIPNRDLAFIRVKTALKPLVLSRLDQIKPGRMVVAIGSPGVGDKRNVLPNTISQGVIGQIVDPDFIAPLQLSIAVNPGNSGGPAIDASGRVVGVITLKGIKVDGIAYCVPSDQLYQELLKLYKE